MAIPNLRFQVSGAGWPVSKPQSMIIPAGTVVDTSQPAWAALAGMVPVDAIPLDQVTADWMVSYGVSGLYLDPNRVRVGPGVVSRALDQPADWWSAPQWYLPTPRLLAAKKLRGPRRCCPHRLGWWRLRWRRPRWGRTRLCPWLMVRPHQPIQFRLDVIECGPSGKRNRRLKKFRRNHNLALQIRITPNRRMLGPRLSSRWPVSYGIGYGNEAMAMRPSKR